MEEGWLLVERSMTESSRRGEAVGGGETLCEHYDQQLGPPCKLLMTIYFDLLTRS